MWTDIVDLRDFYGGRVGKVARRMIGRRLRMIWPDVSGQRVLGLGYATPYLNVFRAEAERVVAVMPAAQGVLRWPADEPSLVGLSDETELPFPDLSMDRVVLVHALECAEHVRPMLREIWRVLADSGKLVVVVPNRRGVWARFERTPFGHGRPYSRAQLARVLRDNMFTPLDTHRALFVPPTRSRLVLSAAQFMENIGVRFFPGFAGVILTEAVKQIYAATPVLEGARKRKYATVVERSGHLTRR